MKGRLQRNIALAELVGLGLSPRVLGLDLAARYVGLSSAAFRKAVRDGRYPAAIEDGRRRQWDIKALDAALDRRSGLAHAIEDEMMRAIDAA